MKINTLVICVVVALVFGGVGYFLGKSVNNDSEQVKNLQDSMTMMKEQSASIQKMAEIMRSSGVAMQEMGTKYKDDKVVSYGKDLEMVGEKYKMENTTVSGGDGSMEHMMGN